MASPPCRRCGAPAAEAHHPEGTVAGRYLSPNFIVTFCIACHRSEHRLRAAVGLDRGLGHLGPLEMVEVSLRRLGLHLGFAAPADDPFWRCLGVVLVRLADDLSSLVAIRGEG